MRDLLQTFLIVSVAYIVTFSLTFGFVFPLQQLLFSGVSTQVRFAIFAAWSASNYTVLLWMERDVLSFTGELLDDFTICGANGTRFVSASS